MPQKTGKIGLGNYPLLLQQIAEGRTAVELGSLFDVNPETIRKFARKRGLSIKKVDVRMDAHPAWRGGVTLDRSGYVLQRVVANGPFGYLIRAIQKRGASGADYAGYAPVHRIAMHEKIGRPLRKGEVVDHIDGDLKNNAPDNLRLFSSNAEHLRETLKGRKPNWTPEGFARITGRPKKNPPPHPDKKPT